MISDQSKVVFITGGNGFVGSNLAKFLVEKKFDVNLLVRKKSDLWRLKSIIKKVKLHIGNIEEKQRLSEIIKQINPKYIIHLSSYGNTSSENDLNLMVKINILGLKNLLEVSENINYKSLIISGSSSEYGFKNKSMKETDYLLPNSYYSATKGAATLIAQSFAFEKNKPISILRLFSVFGPFEENNRLIPIIIKKAIKQEKIFITKGPIRRDFIFIDDVVNAFYKTMNHKINNGSIINIGTGKQYTNEEVVKIIEKILKIKLEIGNYPKKVWDTKNWVANINKAKKELNWQPQYSLEKGLKKTVLWYKDNN